MLGFFGTTCARLDDLDRDGRDEWGIGAPGLSLQQFLAGGAFLFTASGLGVVDDDVRLQPILAAGSGAGEGETDSLLWALVAWDGLARSEVDAPTLVLASGGGPTPVDLALPEGARGELAGWTLRLVVLGPDGTRASHPWRPGVESHLDNAVAR